MTSAGQTGMSFAETAQTVMERAENSTEADKEVKGREASGVLDSIAAPDVLKKLDLTVLHELIISNELGYSKEEQMSQDGIKYIKQEFEAFDMIDKGTAEASFIMAYPKMQDIKDISAAGYRMPQKSTYFYPKLLSGVAINPLK